MKRHTSAILSVCSIMLCCIFTSCSEEDGLNHTNNITKETQYANMFAKDVLEYYYYWNKEIAGDLNLLNPKTNADPIKTVDEIRYHNEERHIDRWTMLTDDIEQFTSSVEGTSKTFGYKPIVYRLKENGNELVAAIAYVSEKSPAEEAGLERGDIIYKINNETLTTDNYEELFYGNHIKLSLAKFKNNIIEPTGEEVALTARTMYENPILHYKVFDVEGKKVGYLAYNSFDLESINQLIKTSKEFKANGVKELILDLRYNGGGFVITENVMASMYAPQKAVDGKEVFAKEDYNNNITELYKNEGISTVTHFDTEFYYPDRNIDVSTKDANIGLTKIYGIVTANTASASEALLGGLMPYMDVEIIGEKSHGKYCTGWVITAKDSYQKVPNEIKNWGMYVMASLYKNAENNTPCMPDGLIPDVTVEDKPMESFQIGDANEAMLKATLSRAAGITPQSGRSISNTFCVFDTPKKTNFGKRILIMEK